MDYADAGPVCANRKPLGMKYKIGPSASFTIRSERDYRRILIRLYEFVMNIFSSNIRYWLFSRSKQRDISLNSCVER